MMLASYPQKVYYIFGYKVASDFCCSNMTMRNTLKFLLFRL